MNSGGALWRCRSASQGVGADLLSQLAGDAVSMLMGTLLPADSREAALYGCLEIMQFFLFFLFFLFFFCARCLPTTELLLAACLALWIRPRGRQAQVKAAL